MLYHTSLVGRNSLHSIFCLFRIKFATCIKTYLAYEVAEQNNLLSRQCTFCFLAKKEKLSFHCLNNYLVSRHSMGTKMTMFSFCLLIQGHTKQISLCSLRHVRSSEAKRFLGSCRNSNLKMYTKHF